MVLFPDYFEKRFADHVEIAKEKLYRSVVWRFTKPGNDKDSKQN